MLAYIMNYVSIIAALAGIAYITWYGFFCKHENGGKWLPNYSASYRLFYKNGKPYNWGIYACTIAGLFLLSAWNFSIASWYQTVFMVLVAFYLMAVGCFPGVGGVQSKLHIYAVKFCILFAVAWLLTQPWVAYTAIPIPLVLYIIMSKKYPEGEGLFVEWMAFCMAYLATIALAIYALV